MLPKQTNLRPDVAQLIQEGFEVTIEHDHLIMRNVPYVTANKEIQFGKLISTLAGSRTESARPDTHVILFAGEYPCDKNGVALEKLRNSSGKFVVGGDITADHRFSSKPKQGYADYYEKMVTYAALISSPASALDETVTARTFRVVQSPDDSPFVYFDNASGRVGIYALTQKLKMKSVAIVGLGGTGSYILDFIAKTPIEKIHLIDGDLFEQHNAFRSPGAASVDDLRERQFKVDYLSSIYERMHKGIITHQEFISTDNLKLLANHDMVFLCMDRKAIKRPVIEFLEKSGICFIDVGMGVEFVDDGLTALLRTTTSTPDHRNHVHDRHRVPMDSREGDDLYTNNIQISELNALNACLAVIRWKKLCGFFKDTEGEYFSVFALDGNHIINEDSDE